MLLRSACPNTAAITHPPVGELELVRRSQWPVGTMMSSHDYGRAARGQILNDCLQRPASRAVDSGEGLIQ